MVRVVLAMVWLLLALPAFAQAAFPGTNGRIAFATQVGDWEIAVMEADGSNVRLLTDNTTFDDDPNLSPTGAKVAWTAGTNDHNDIMVGPAIGTGATVNLTEAPANVFAYSPTWSPDGTKVAFVIEGPGFSGREIYVAAADGSGDPVRITVASTLQDKGDLSWSPDGTTIAFSARIFTGGSPAFNRDIYTAPVDGGAAPTRITFDAADDREPDFSPDGNKLVFASDRDTTNAAFPDFNVFVMPSAGGTATRLTTNLGTDQSPVFSPDGTKVLYARDFRLHTVPAAGGAPERVGTYDEAMTDPHWGAPGPQPPAVTSPPVIEGNAVVGGQVSCAPGVWNHGPTFAYAWLRDGGALATGQTYDIVTDDVGKQLTCKVTATNAYGSKEATSAAVQPQAQPTGQAPSSIESPTVTGSFVDGATLSGTVGLWDGTPVLTYARQWLRCDGGGGSTCEPIGGATGETHALTADDVGHRLRLRVTATNGFGNATRESDPGAVVAQAPPANRSVPTVSGTPESGQTLTLTSEGTWSGTAPLSFSVRWIACRRVYLPSGSFDNCVEVGQGREYRVRDADRGRRLYATVTASNAAGSATAHSAIVRIPAPIACDLEGTDQEHLCGKTPIVFIPGFGASALGCTNAAGYGSTLWPDALFVFTEWPYLELGADGVSSASGRCAETSGPNGDVLKSLLFIAKDIHTSSQKWLERIAPGYSYAFGWDWRRGPDQTIARLDAYIEALRHKHGSDKVVIVNHSYGGLLTRWYIDDPARAKKVVRVANVASPWWGSPKAWLALVHGFETPELMEKMDWFIPNSSFRAFARNLTGLYYLFPNRAWFSSAPTVLREWLEINEVPRNFTETMSSISAYGGNGVVAQRAADGHRDHLDGFKGKQRAGVDWRSFVGTGLPTLGHIREGGDLQYSWINGDGTVPMISQRQFARRHEDQLGERIPVYYFCNYKHMEELEVEEIQNALRGFLLDGTNPVADGNPLREHPCKLYASEFRVTGAEDAKSVGIAADSEAVSGTRRAPTRAAGTKLTLADAEGANLIDTVGDVGETRTFVTSSRAATTVSLPKGAALLVTPLKADGSRGKPVQYGPLRRAGSVTVAGPRVMRARSGGKVLRPHKLDRSAPRVRARVRRQGRFVLLSPVAHDVSGVLATYIRIGAGREKRWRSVVKVPARKLRTVRIRGVDVFGNLGKPARVR